MRFFWLSDLTSLSCSLVVWFSPSLFVPIVQGLVELLNSHREMWSTMREESTTLWHQKSKVRRDEALAALAAAREKEAKGKRKSVY